MDVHELIPFGDLPRSGVPGNLVTSWRGLDTEEEYRRRGHPKYDETSIEYRFNSQGYRCPEFDEVADIRMISIDNLNGNGLPQDAIFHERFAERLRRETGKTVVNWNLAEDGTGNDVIERVLHTAVPALDPHIVLILFAGVDHREYLSPKGIRVPFFPGLAGSDSRIVEVVQRYVALFGPEVNTMLGNLAGIANRQDDELRFYRSYKSLEALLSGRCWLFADANEELEQYYAFKHVDADRYVGSLEVMDFARDCIFPGPFSHEALARKFWSAFERMRGRGDCDILEGDRSEDARENQ